MPQRQFVNYSFYKIDPSWRLRAAELREADKAEFADLVEKFGDEMFVRTYSTVGTRGDTDVMLWRVSDDINVLNRSSAALNQTALAPYLRVPYHYLAMTRRSMYVANHHHEGQEGTRTKLRPVDAPYLVVYPFVKTRNWYALSFEERQKMMDTHIQVGHKYPNIKINTTYSFGLDDQEFVVAFESDSLSDFLDLVMELRETNASLYTVRDTPSFSCIRMTTKEALDQIG